MGELVLALETLHTAGICHKNLRPTNVFVNYTGHIKLSDYWHSNPGGGEYTEMRRSRKAGFTAGSTPQQHSPLSPGYGLRGKEFWRYLSPEAILSHDISVLSDWWALGIIMFEMLTGTLPFPGESPETLCKQARDSSAVLEHRFAEAKASPQAVALVKALLQADPAKRLGKGGAQEVRAHPFFQGLSPQI